MKISTKEQFDSLMNDSNTNMSTIIEFPGGTIDYNLVIKRPCTIFGNDTTINIDDSQIEFAIEVYNQVDLSNIMVINKERKGIRIDSIKDSRFENVSVSESDVGWFIKDSYNNEFEECKSFSNSMGFEIVGSSDIAGDIDSHQSFGLSNLKLSDKSGLKNQLYKIIISSKEYTFTAQDPLTIESFITDLLLAKDSDNNVLKSNFEVSLTNGDIRITSLTDKSVKIERVSDDSDLLIHFTGFDKKKTSEIQFNDDVDFSLQSKYFEYDENIIWYNVANGGINPSDPGRPLDGTTKNMIEVKINKDATDVADKTFDEIEKVALCDVELDGKIIKFIGKHTIKDVDSGFIFKEIQAYSKGVLPTPISKTEEKERTDRVHNNVFTACLSHDNSFGFKLVNSNHNKFENCRVFKNKNIGFWQTPYSYSNTFYGEVYQNEKYGARNTDKKNILDMMNSWWGDLEGPSLSGKGDGDKISSYIQYDPWNQSGTELELTYPETRRWIWSMLGYPQVEVELTEEQVSDSITMALRKFHYYRAPQPYYYYTYLSHGSHEVELPKDILKESVLEVSYSPGSDLFSNLSANFSGESFFLTYYMNSRGIGFLTDFYIAMSYKETFQKTLGIQSSYEFLTHTNKDGDMRDFVRLYPAPSGNGATIALKVNRPLSEEEVDEVMWIRKYALTYSKENLGQIRSKFISLPGPTGEISIKGSELIQEALAERELLNQEIIRRGEPLTFSVG